jgi:hypothetical protein
MPRWKTAAMAAALLAVTAAAAAPASAQPAATHRGVQPVSVPRPARAASVAHPTRVIGHGTAASCTSAAVIAAVRAGGIITFSCGPNPVTIRMSATAKIVNAHGPRIVIDGGGLVTLSGEGDHRILYMDTCDPAQGWTTSHCQNQDSPRLVVQNLTFVDGNSTGQTFDGGGGGAIFVRGGRVKIVNSTFLDNRCERTGPDIGGGAVRVLSQDRGRPVYIVHSTFRHNACSNGGALSSIGVTWVLINSRFTGNRAIGTGANPARRGTPGGGSGGAIYTDGDRYTVRIAGTVMASNHANEGGGAVFFVSNDRTGTLTIAHSTLHNNPNDGFQTLPGIYFLGAHRPRIEFSIVD